MKYIIAIIKKFLPKDIPKPVGRWRIENCNTQINNKVDLSNEDHCGPCGQYALEKIDNKNNQSLKNLFEIRSNVQANDSTKF
jgi:hypothetical protein